MQTAQAIWSGNVDLCDLRDVCSFVAEAVKTAGGGSSKS